jgi:hypothetical protein
LDVRGRCYRAKMPVLAPTFILWLEAEVGIEPA